ncbi:MAG: polyhydroxybutyrate depolymerase [Myxococcales bacterium]|nr:polyhydroxybutyrate depolymerase [Myxococcales bacterium]
MVSSRRLAALVVASGLVVALACGGSLGCSSDTSTLSATGDGGASGTSSAAGDPDASATSGTSGTGTSGTTADGGSSGDPATALTPGKTTRTFTAAGKSRSVIIVVPTTVAAGKVPLVVALHGNGDTNTNFISVTTTLESLAESKGFVLAAPQGISQNISIGGQMVNGVDWDPYRDAAGGNIDLPLIDAIFADLGASSSVDASKHVVFGYSQGGYMSFRYGMDNSAALACSGIIGAANPLGPQLTAGAPRKIPVALQIGTNDGAIGQAQNTKADLESKGFPLDYHEIQGAGHVPVAGGVTVPLTYCLGQTKP